MLPKKKNINENGLKDKHESNVDDMKSVNYVETENSDAMTEKTIEKKVFKPTMIRKTPEKSAE